MRAAHPLKVGLLAAAALTATISTTTTPAQAQTAPAPTNEAVARFCVETLRQAGQQVVAAIEDGARAAIQRLRRLDDAGAKTEALVEFARQAKAILRRLGERAVEAFDEFAARCIDFLVAHDAAPALIAAVADARDSADAAVKAAVDRACDAIQQALDRLLSSRLDGGLGGEGEPALAG